MKKKLILLIMPVSDHFDHFKSMLSYNDFEVITANDGKNGFELTRDVEPDIIIAATELEKIDGIELCYMLRQSSRLAATPFILIADDTNPEVRINGFRSGVDDIIPLSISRRELITRIETLINRYAFLTKQILKPNQSLIGKLQDFKAIEIIQLLNLNHKTGVLKIDSMNQIGKIAFYDGKITWSHCNGVDGEESIYAMAGWEQGSFIFEKDLIPTEVNVLKPTMQLILDCCQRLDELQSNRSQQT